MKPLWTRVRSAWRRLWRSDRFDAEMQDEMRFHVEMEAERLVRDRGLDPREARRQAHVAFGGVEKYKEEGRDTRGLQWIDAMSLDCRLGVRMLVKYPWLTLVGSFAIAVAIAIGAIFFEAITVVLYSTLPVEDGERVVSLQYSTGSPGNPERRVLHDFVSWRQALVSVQELSAFRTVAHNLVSGEGVPESIRVAEITASAFRVARTPPLLGRHLVPDDEREGAPPVMVIGHEAWQSRFAGDPGIVGRTVKLGAAPCIVVGVMPQGFAFPVDHQFWTALRASPSDFERLQGPALHVFGRLAPGVTLEEAQAELTIVGQRTAAAHPEAYGRLRPVVLPYTREHVEIDDPRIAWALWIVQLLVSGLLVVVSVNLAILVYARTVARLGEIAVRSALGASRRRILAQLFMEALALSAVGAITGLFVAQVALRWMQSWIKTVERVPFWIDLDLSIGTVGYAVGLAVLAAAIAGILPGLKATGRPLYPNLRELSGGTGTRLGRMWTSLIVAQVATAVAILPVAIFMVSEVVRMEMSGPGFPAEEILVAKVPLSQDASARQLELVDRLEAEPGVAAVTFSSSIPGFEPGYRIEFDGGAPVPEAGTLETNSMRIGLTMFDAYGAEIVVGRAFEPSDLGGGATAVIVNRAFVRQFLGNRSDLGHRFRYARAQPFQPGTERQGTWYEIVGVVSDFPSFAPRPGADSHATVYHPVALEDVNSAVLSVRLKGGVPAGFIGRFRQIGADVDPALPLRDVTLLSEFYDRNRSAWRFVAWALALVTSSVLLLSAAGIYALMSFTVAQRTRVIGIRAALGAGPRALLASIFGRAMRHLTVGLLVGSLLSGASLSATGLGLGQATALLLAVASMILLVGLLAALGPARRALRIQATEALRTDA
jgi:predicted permease